MFLEYFHFSRNWILENLEPPVFDSLSIHLLFGQSDSQLPFDPFRVKFCQRTDIIDVMSMFSQELHSSLFAELRSNYI